MKITSWNVNGLRSCVRKGFMEFAAEIGADVILVQETQTNAPLPEIESLAARTDAAKYRAAWNFAERKGYSGTLCLFRKKPERVTLGLGVPRLDVEGRVITLEYPGFYIVNAYVPNSTATLARRYFRLDWDKAFREYVCGLAEEMPVIIGGDFNVARAYIDIFPENLRNEENPTGFTDEERDAFQALLDGGFTDVFRMLYPKREAAYTWWSTRMNKREQNQGWRIDYFLVSNDIKSKVKKMALRADIYGSDHCPIELEVAL